ncbi:MAG: hypothetical protein WBE29_18250 [Pseudolabrys sp.]
MPRFVLRPAVKFVAAETLGLALIAVVTLGRAPPIVGIDLAPRSPSAKRSSCTVVSNDKRGVMRASLGSPSMSANRRLTEPRKIRPTVTG